MKYYRLDEIKKYNAKYNVIIGGRSDGKTYAVLEEIVRNYLCADVYKPTGAIIRRWSEDFVGKRGQQMFSALVQNGLIEKYSGGKWNSVKYYASKWYMCYYDADKHSIIECDDNPFCYGFALTSQEHDKSTSYPTITTVLFDEFITRNVYLPDEFVLFCNVLSTIVRERDNLTVYMCGNTINKYCPYFDAMGLKHVDKMKRGTIDLYKYGDSGLTVAMEYCDTAYGIFGGKKSKKSDIFFAFDNARLSMITGGDWELDIYPHCPRKYLPKEVRFIFFIEFDSQILQCEIVCGKNDCFVFVHPKTTEFQRKPRDLIYTTKFANPNPYIRKSFLKPADDVDRKILALWNAGKFFYSDNNTGDIMRNFTMLKM